MKVKIQVEIALSQASQYEVSVSAASGQVTVLSSGPANVAVHGQVIVSQGQSQDRVTFKVNGSQGSFVASQAQVAPQENVSTQDSSSQAAVPTLSQFSQTSPSLSQGLGVVTLSTDSKSSSNIFSRFRHGRTKGSQCRCVPYVLSKTLRCS